MTPRARTPSTRGGGRTSTWTGTERSSRSSGPAAHTTDVSQVWRRRARTSGPRATVVVPSPLARASPTEGRIASARSVSGRAGGATTTASPEDHGGGDRDRDERDRPDGAAAHERPGVGGVGGSVLREERAE